MRQHYPKSYRLLKTDDFSSVFMCRRAVNIGVLRIYFAPNQYGHARLGLIVSKKTAKHAVARNYMKRYLRQWFRQNHHALPAQDLIIQVKNAFNRQTAAEVGAALDGWQKRQNLKKASS